MSSDAVAPVALGSFSPLRGRSVLVTGGTGSFGAAFVAHALAAGAARVAIYSRDEAKHAAMRSAFHDDARLRFLIGDVRDLDRLTDACRGVEIVVHAAALKRIEVCESDPNEAIKTNIVGTQHVARACIANGVSKAVLLSTDKAASPNTLYGATKLAAERAWLASNVYAAGTSTRFAASRYGNVLGSRGSVVPIFRAQAASGTLTVTDRRMTRFWMTMADAVALVVLALEEMRGGEVFIPRVHAAPVLRLAEAIAPSCVVREIGIRAGEKLHECLITADEARSTYDAGTHFVIDTESRTWGEASPLPFAKVPDGFSFSSDTAVQLSVDDLQAMVAA